MQKLISIKKLISIILVVLFMFSFFVLIDTAKTDQPPQPFNPCEQLGPPRTYCFIVWINGIPVSATCVPQYTGICSLSPD